MPWDDIWINANLATMVASGEKYGALQNAVIAADSGRIAWIGPHGDLPDQPNVLARNVHDACARWITPGLIDCHTHIVYGGSRAHEFEMRLDGASYEEIARAGGGIVSTVRATRESGETEIAARSSARLETVIVEGVTTVEIKSGYGLDIDTEIKQLRIARAIAEHAGVNVRTTFLGAHALPPEYAGEPDTYINFVCNDALPAVAAAGLADAVDAFCETISFDAAQTERVFTAAREHGLPIKLHADQLSDGGGAALAAKYAGLSADHL